MGCLSRRPCVSERPDGGVLFGARRLAVHAHGAHASLASIRAMQILALASMVASMNANPVMAAGAASSALTLDGPVIALVPPATSNASPAASAAPSGAGSAKPATAAFGAKDSWRWQLTMSWMGNANDINQLEGEWSASWFFMQNVSMDFGLSGDAFMQPGDNAGGGGASLMFRWHFLARETWSVFADAGCGMMFTNEPVPNDGGRVNFTPRAGLGGTYALSDTVRLIGGLRWYHISNANTGESNPGWNALQVYGGVSLPF